MQLPPPDRDDELYDDNVENLNSLDSLFLIESPILIAGIISGTNETYGNCVVSRSTAATSTYDVSRGTWPSDLAPLSFAPTAYCNSAEDAQAYCDYALSSSSGYSITINGYAYTIYVKSCTAKTGSVTHNSKTYTNYTYTDQVGWSKG